MCGGGGLGGDIPYVCNLYLYEAFCSHVLTTLNFVLVALPVIVCSTTLSRMPACAMGSAMLRVGSGVGWEEGTCLLTHGVGTLLL